MATARGKVSIALRRRRAQSSGAKSKQQPIGRRTRPRPPKWLVFVASIGIVLLGFQVVSHLYRRSTIRQPPQFEAAGIDPAIAAEILEARRNVIDHPTSAFSWGHLGMCFLAHDFWQNAAVCLRQAEQLDPSESRWPYFNAAAMRPVDDAGFVSQLQLAVSLCPTDVAAPRLQLAEALLERGALADSERFIRQVLEQDPRNPRALLELGQLHLARSDLAQARRSLSASAAVEPTRKTTHVSLGNVYRRMGNAQLAESEEATAARLPEDPPWPDPWNDELDALRTGVSASLSRADQLINEGRWNDAVRPLQQIANAYPDSSRAWMTLGMALQLQGNLEEAETALRKAAKIDPARADVQLNLAAVLLRRGLFEQAETAGRNAVHIQPDLGDAWFVLGVALQKQRKFQDSLSPFQKAIQFKPEAAEPHVGIANSLFALGRTENARDEIRRALQNAQSDPRARELMHNLLGETRPAN